MPALKTKHVPLRSCIVCRKKTSKGELTRVVRTELEVQVDPSGRKAGRGAYICRDPGCWQKALLRNHLDHAFKRRLSPPEKKLLQDYAEAFS